MENHFHCKNCGGLLQEVYKRVLEKTNTDRGFYHLLVCPTCGDVFVFNDGFNELHQLDIKKEI